MTGDKDVYRTRIVKSGRADRGDEAINYFSDPDEAKRYLEAYIEEKLDAQPTEWRREQSADEKWSIQIVPDRYARAVVMGVDVHESADGPIEALREFLSEVRGEP